MMQTKLPTQPTKIKNNEDNNLYIERLSRFQPTIVSPSPPKAISLICTRTINSSLTNPSSQSFTSPPEHNAQPHQLYVCVYFSSVFFPSNQTNHRCIVCCWQNHTCSSYIYHKEQTSYPSTSHHDNIRCHHCHCNNHR